MSSRKINFWSRYRSEGDIGFISLPGGEEAIIDASDADKCALHTWYCLRISRSSTVYVQAPIRSSKQKWSTLLLHHLILGRPPKGKEVDHVNGNGLDNRKVNLRFCSRSQNMANQPSRMSKTVGFKGVRCRGKRSRWMACIWHKGRYKYLGTFGNKDEAALAYDAANIKLFGSFGRVNFPLPERAGQNAPNSC